MIARCRFCRQNMANPRTVSCEVNKHIQYPDGTVLPAIPYDAACLRPYVTIAPVHCRDCGVGHGGTHHPPCCLEDCPRCGGQLLSCECFQADEDRRYQPSVGPSRGETDQTRVLRDPLVRHPPEFDEPTLTPPPEPDPNQLRLF